TLAFLDLVHHDRAFHAAVLRDLTQRLLDRAADDVDAELLLRRDLELLERRQRADERHAAARDDALLDGRAGRMQRVLDASLLLLHLGLGGRADLDHGDAADELGEALLQLLAIVVARGVLDLRADLLDAPLDVTLLARAVDGGVVLVDRDALGAAEILEREVLELEAEILSDRLAAREDRDVLEHLLAAIAEARRLDRARVERGAQLVDDQRRQRLAVDVLGDDEERLAGARDLLEQRQELLHVRDLLLVDEHERVLEDGF